MISRVQLELVWLNGIGFVKQVPITCLGCIIFYEHSIWLGKAFHRVIADVLFSRLPYRVVRLQLGTSDVAETAFKSSMGVYH